MTLIPSTAAGGGVTASPPGADDFTFRAPRYGDLVACPYCAPDTFKPSRCDHCGDEGILFASEVFQ